MRQLPRQRVPASLSMTPLPRGFRAPLTRPPSNACARFARRHHTAGLFVFSHTHRLGQSLSTVYRVLPPPRGCACRARDVSLRPLTHVRACGVEAAGRAPHARSDPPRHRRHSGRHTGHLRFETRRSRPGGAHSLETACGILAPPTPPLSACSLCQHTPQHWRRPEERIPRCSTFCSSSP